MKNKQRVLAITMALLMVASTAFAVTFTQLQITATTIPSTITPGSDGYVTLQIANTGVVSSNTIEISSVSIDSPILVQSYTTDLGSIDPGKSITTNIKFTVPKDAKPGYYIMNFQIKDCSDSSCREYAQNAVITVQTTPSVSISIDPSEFKPGETTNLTFVINNKGGQISDFTLTWHADEIIPLGQDNRVFVSSISGSSTTSVTVPVSVIPNKVTGVYTMEIAATYNDQTGSTKSLVLNTGFIIKERLNLITTLESQDIIYANSRGTATIKISNAGQDIKFLVVKVLQKDNLTKTVPETIYVGNLKSDDYDTEKLTIETSNIEPTKYTLKLQLQYQDIFGKSYQDDREIDISITQKQAGFPVALAAGIIFVLLIVGVFVYTKMRRKK